MLVLTRRQGEAIRVGSNIVVTVARIRGNKVRLGIEAPDSVRIDRSEVRQRKCGDRNVARTLGETCAEAPP